MLCPRCDEDDVKKIRFKSDGKVAYICEFCESLWFEGEEISPFTARALRSFKPEEGIEYVWDEVADKDEDRRHTYYHRRGMEEYV